MEANQERDVALMISSLKTQVRVTGGGSFKENVSVAGIKVPFFLTESRIVIFFEGIDLHQHNLLTSDGYHVLYAENTWYVESGILLRCIEKIQGGKGG